MPTVEDYLRQADRNADVAGHLAGVGGIASPISLQWAVVCMFYAGVHYVNAYLQGCTGTVPRSHSDREMCVSMHMDAPVDDALRELRTVGHAVRYKLLDPTGPDYEAVLEDLDVIRTFVNNELRPDTIH